MSDFLDSVISRSTMESAILPRVVSRFEPLGTTSPGKRALDDSGPPDHESSEARTADPAASVFLAPQAAVSAPPSIADQSDDQRRPRDEHSQPPIAPVIVNRALRDEAPESQQDLPRHGAVGAAHASGDHLPLRHRVEAIAAELRRIGCLQAVEKKNGHAADEQHEANAPQRPSRETQQPSSPILERRLPASSPVPPRIVPEQLARLSSAPVSESTVNVTIGRLEVRAPGEGAAPATREKSRESRVMTLDQYLRRRGGGDAA